MFPDWPASSGWTQQVLNRFFPTKGCGTLLTARSTNVHHSSAKWRYGILQAFHLTVELDEAAWLLSGDVLTGGLL